MSQIQNIDLNEIQQDYGQQPLAVRETNQYKAEYIKSFVEKWDELIDWPTRSANEGCFFIDVLKSRGKSQVLDVATGTGFHSVQLLKAGFDVTSSDGSAAMLAKAFENAQGEGIILHTVQADWRSLCRHVHHKFDAIICLGNSFTHLFQEADRRRALAEFYAALKHDGILIIDHRNYDAIVDLGYSGGRKYYYCGEKVTVSPEYIDDGLARFTYSFSDGAEYKLNMFPLRKKYMRNLLSESAFQEVHTFSDFQETTPDDQPDYFIHIAEKEYREE